MVGEKVPAGWQCPDELDEPVRAVARRHRELEGEGIRLQLLVARVSALEVAMDELVAEQREERVVGRRIQVERAAAERLQRRVRLIDERRRVGAEHGRSLLLTGLGVRQALALVDFVFW